MFVVRSRVVVPVALLGLGLTNAPCLAAPAPKEAEPKLTVVLPKDPKAVVLSSDPGAGGFIRKREAPYLKIQADGQVTVTNMHDGSKAESKLTAKDLDDLLRFVIQDKDLFGVTAEKISDGITEAAGKGPFVAVNGAGTSVIGVQANGKSHEVSYRGASADAQVYPKVEVLARFAAVAKRPSDFAAAVAKRK